MTNHSLHLASSTDALLASATLADVLDASALRVECLSLESVKCEEERAAR